ncbi:hypothetical protein CHUAL_014018 [Chamberlinius hualienensis]
MDVNAMETYLNKIFPIVAVFRLFGFDLHPDSTKPKSFLKSFCLFALKCLRIFHISTLVAMVIYFVVLTRNSKTQLLVVVFFMSYGFCTTQAVMLRYIFGKNFQNLINLAEETNQLLKKFEGKEQPFLKKIHLLCHFWYFYVYSIIEYTLSLFDIANHAGKATDIQTVELSYYEVKELVHFVFGFSLPAYHLFMPVVILTIWTQSLALIFIFQLLGNFSQSKEDTPIDRKKKLVKFIQFHQKACSLVKLANNVFGQMLLWIMSVMTFYLLLHFVLYLNLKMVMSLVNIGQLLLNLMVCIVLCGVTNKMVFKSLENCRKMVVGTKLSIKVELYEYYVKLSNPGIRLGEFAMLNVNAVFIILDFIATYMALLHQKDKQPELQMH